MGALDCVSGLSGQGRLKSTESTEVFTMPMPMPNSMESSADTHPKPADVESQFTKSNSSNSKHSIWLTLTIDIPLLLLVIAIIIVFESGLLPHHKAGFYCNDPALSFAYTGDTVSNTSLILSIIFLPLIVIFPCELIFLKTNYSNRSRIYQAIRNTLWLYRCYAYGLFLNLGIVEAIKIITGSPRPAFFDLCEPDAGKTCQGSEYVSSYECTSTRYKMSLQADSHHSFPSGHTSLSVYCGFFIAWYLQRRAFDWRHRSILFIPTLQLALMTYAAVCSFTRISDHRHHWWDVLVGSVVGVACVLYSVLVLCENFASRVKSSESQVCLYNGHSQNPVP